MSENFEQKRVFIKKMSKKEMSTILPSLFQKNSFLTQFKEISNENHGKAVEYQLFNLNYHTMEKV